MRSRAVFVANCVLLKYCAYALTMLVFVLFDVIRVITNVIKDTSLLICASIITKDSQEIIYAIYCSMDKKALELNLLSK